MEEQSKQDPFSDNNLDSPEYRARLLRKLNCLVALLEVAISRVHQTLAGPDPDVERLERIREPSRAEYARLISKGRLLYEHCMTEVSNACIVGFMHHELTKSRKAERVILDLLGWMVAQRFDISELVDEEGDEALRRCAHTDYMIDQGVSFLHGLDRAAASALAADKEPID